MGLSMGNIDTPITIDNKHKFVNKIEQRSLNDSTFPMTPTKMPNLSMINIKEEDNDNAVDSDDDNEQLKNLQSDIDDQTNDNENPLEEDEDEQKKEMLDDKTKQ